MMHNGDRAARQEVAFVINRLREIHANPVPGKFDLDHLQAIHAHLFQDVPDQRPGLLREDTGVYYKVRHLEDSSFLYRVDYATHSVGNRIGMTLDEFGGIASLRGLNVNEAAKRIERLYGDLDYAHGFYDGNSRTLREFTRSLALKAGYDLDWTPTSVDADKRNYLYMARDILVLERGLADTTLDRGTDVRSLAAEKLVALRSTGLSLETMIRDNLSPARERPLLDRVPLELSSDVNAPQQAARSDSNAEGRKGLGARLLRQFAKGGVNRDRPGQDLSRGGRDYEG